MPFELDPKVPLVLLLGLDTEGIRSTLKTSGQQYKLKYLNSSPDNWAEIPEYFERFAVASAVMKLDPVVFSRLIDPRYHVVRGALCERLRQVPHAIFVYEPLLTADIVPAQEDLSSGPAEGPLDGSNDYEPWRDDPAPSEVRALVRTLIESERLNVIPYRSNAEMTVM